MNSHLLPLVGSSSLSAYWHGFVDYWSNLFAQQDGVVMIALVVAALSIFIITRGKWRK